MLKISPLKKEEVNQISQIASGCFSGLSDLKLAKKWVRGNLRCCPRMKYFAAKEKNEVLGYALWQEKGGFRKEAVFELEQVAVKEKARGRGVASLLIIKSKEIIEKELSKRGSKLKLIEVTTGISNQAQKLYQKTLQAETEAIIKSFFREDEAIMIKRFL